MTDTDTRTRTHVVRLRRASRDVRSIAEAARGIDNVGARHRHRTRPVNLVVDVRRAFRTARERLRRRPSARGGRRQVRHLEVRRRRLRAGVARAAGGLRVAGGIRRTRSLSSEVLARVVRRGRGADRATGGKTHRQRRRSGQRPRTETSLHLLEFKEQEPVLEGELLAVRTPRLNVGVGIGERFLRLSEFLAGLLELCVAVVKRLSEARDLVRQLQVLLLKMSDLPKRRKMSMSKTISNVGRAGEASVISALRERHDLMSKKSNVTSDISKRGAAEIRMSSNE